MLKMNRLCIFVFQYWLELAAGLVMAIQLLQVLLADMLVWAVRQIVLEHPLLTKAHLEVLTAKSRLLEDVVGVVCRSRIDFSDPEYVAGSLADGCLIVVILELDPDLLPAFIIH